MGGFETAFNQSLNTTKPRTAKSMAGRNLPSTQQITDSFVPGQGAYKGAGSSPKASTSSVTATRQVTKSTPKPKSSRGASLFKFGKSFASSMTAGEQKFSQGIARTLPGGSNDLSAEQKSSQADQNNAKTAATLFKSGKISKTKYQKLTAQNAAQANKTSGQVKQTEKGMPTKSQIALGAASTTADILSGGTFGAVTKGAKAGKVLKSAEIAKSAKGLQVAEDAAKVGKSKAGKTLLMAGNTAKDLAPTVAGSAAAGGLNAAAAGGTKGQIRDNAVLGALFPIGLKGAGNLVSHGASAVADKVGTKGAQETLHNAKVNTLLTAAEKSQPKVNAVINPDHVSQGLTKDTIIHTPSTELHLGSEMAGKKIDNAKVAQYTKQIKDGEPIEPVVVHDVNGQKVVVDGQHRLAAMQKLGITDIPTVEKVPGAEPKAPTAEAAIAAPTAKPITDKSDELVGKNIQVDKTPNGSYRAMDTSSDSGYGLSNRATGKTPEEAVANLKQKTGSASSLKTATPGQVGKTVEAPKIALAETPSTRALKPSETAHMEPIGGYTHSKDMTNDYADMLRGQEQQIKGGQMVKQADGTVKRISEHSKFYREFYHENGKAPTVADYKAEAIRQLESGKAMHGASEDYQKLVAREAKPLPKMERPAPATPDVPTKTSGSAQRLEARAVEKSVAKNFKDAGKAEYSTGSYKVEAQKAVELTDKNPEKAMDIAMGRTPGDNTIHEVAVRQAVENKAIREGDTNTILQLLQSPHHAVTSEAAQRLGAEGYGDGSDVVANLAKLRKARMDVFEAKKGKSVAKATSTEIRQIRAAKPAVTPKTWDDFIEQIKCH